MTRIEQIHITSKNIPLWMFLKFHFEYHHYFTFLKSMPVFQRSNDSFVKQMNYRQVFDHCSL